MELVGEFAEGLGSVGASALFFAESLVQLNYAVVSQVVAALLHVLALAELLLQGLRTALSELLEQYGDLCWSIASAAASSSLRLTQLFINAATSVFNALTWAAGVPKAGAVMLVAAAKSALSFAGSILSLPFQFLAALASGIWMLVTGIWAGAVWVLSSIFAVWAAAVGGLVRVALGWGRWVGRGLFAVASQPLRMSIRLKNHLIETPMEAVYGLMILGAVVYAVRSGLAGVAARQVRGLGLRLGLWVGRVALGVAEGALAVYSPYVPILLAVLRRTYRPAFRVLRWLYRLFKRVLAACLRRSTSQGSNTVAAGRFLPTPRPALTPSSSRIESPSVQSPERLLCVVCQDAEKGVMLEPCRHICVCGPCGAALMDQLRTQRRCPLCRAVIDRLVPVYF